MLGWSLNSWENALVIFLIIAGLFALLAGAATWAVVRLQRIELAKSQQEFEKYKIDAKAEADVKIEAARSEAKVALEKASNESAERIRGVEEKARVDVAKANESAEQAKSDAAEANRKAETERLERIKLEAIVAPRDLSLEKQLSISRSLFKHSGQRIRMKSYVLDTESAVFGQQILNALHGANLSYDDRRMTIQSTGEIATGVRVTGSNSSLVNDILAVLRDAGVVVSPEGAPEGAGMQLSDDGTAVAATIFVGVKPIVPR